MRSTCRNRSRGIADAPNSPPSDAAPSTLIFIDAKSRAIRITSRGPLKALPPQQLANPHNAVRNRTAVNPASVRPSLQARVASSDVRA
jgi:hypothetical protein